MIATPETPDFAETLKHTRDALGAGWTQARLAEHLGVSYVTLNRWENGKAEPGPLARARVLQQINALLSPSETPAPQAAPQERTPPDFRGRASAVRAVAEGERLRSGFLYNHRFATETSLIDPLPHQILAVYQHMLPQSPLRFLLADDAGAGKTIMTGLDLKERISRGLVRRVLIVPPAGLLGNWEREMRLLFGLTFRVVRGSDARDSNPFQGPGSDLLIVSLDTLRQERVFKRLQESDVEPYDTVVFDEAHKLGADQTADGERKTDRYKLAEALCGASDGDPRWHLSWSCPNALLLSATPHMGKSYPYYCLWRLLLPNVLTTEEAFQAFPASSRAAHFLRRMKEEMVSFDEKPLYPTRISKTFSFALQPGEQRLYDEMTDYIETLYNKAARLNQSAARLAMSVFQRRLASSTFAVLRSLERRAERLDRLVQEVVNGAVLNDKQQSLAAKFARDAGDLDAKTADEEEAQDGVEESERVEEAAVAVFAASDLPDLKRERARVEDLLDLAKTVHASGEESKFETLRETIEHPDYRGEKILIFTEHRDTLTHLVQRLEGIGYAGRIAQVHGGMDYEERQEQIEHFRAPDADGGATYLVATDAAGEGINLQFAWLLINFDVPWNPARLEQRMGRIHRYGQKHDPVVICNLVAGETREGRVIQTLLDKLEQIREDTGSDRVFDVVGELLEGLSFTSFLLEDPETMLRRVSELATPAHVAALVARDQQAGEVSTVLEALPGLRRDLDRETFRVLLPGYVRSYLAAVLPLLGIGVEGDLCDADSGFGLRALKPGALDFLADALEFYPPASRRRFTVVKTPGMSNRVFLHPGEPVFDALHHEARALLDIDAVRGAVFTDAAAVRPRLFHLVRVGVGRAARLIGLCQEEDGAIVECPAETLLLLTASDDDAPPYLGAKARQLRGFAPDAERLACIYAHDRVSVPLAAEMRATRQAALPDRESAIRRGFGYLEADLAERRNAWRKRELQNHPRAADELAALKARQRALSAQREAALDAVRREIDEIAPGEAQVLARALIVPSDAPQDALAQDRTIEAEAMRVVLAYEAARGADVQDVSTPDAAVAANLDPWPGFDLLSTRLSDAPADRERAIEVKGRAGTGSVELTENEWSRACNLRDRYWLYVVYDCGSLHPRLLRVRDPFGQLTGRVRQGWIIEAPDIAAMAEE